MDGTAAATPVARYPLALDMAVTIIAEDSESRNPGSDLVAWQCQVQRRDDAGESWRDAVEDDGAAEAFVDVLRHHVSPPIDGFRVVRLVPPPEATGERPVGADQTNTSVVVGERVVVKWNHRLTDTTHPGPLTLAHLNAVRFLGIPTVHGFLLWTTPNGNEVPVAVVSGYLPRARDGWHWCVALVEQRLGMPQRNTAIDTRRSRSSAAAAAAASAASRPLTPSTGALPVLDSWAEDFPARLGRTTAKLHLALATPSRLIPEPVSRVGAGAVRNWHAQARARLDECVRIAGSGVLEGLAEVLLPRVAAMTAAIDQLAELADDLPPDDLCGGPGGGILVQRVHGDLHAGQMLRWPGGIAVIDFDGNPVVDPVPGPGGDPAVQPAARDVAQMLRSLDYVGRAADKRGGFTATAAVDAWSITARRQMLDAYRRELAEAGHPELLDERLLAAFETEQVCRELIYAARHMPSWGYGPLAGIRMEYPVNGYPLDGTTASYAEPPLS